MAPTERPAKKLKIASNASSIRMSKNAKGGERTAAKAGTKAGTQTRTEKVELPSKRKKAPEDRDEDEVHDAAPATFKVIAGSYEKLLYGLEGSVSLSPAGELEWTLEPIFIFPAHVSSLKAVAASPAGGKWLATGSSDEIVKVWDLRRRKEVGGLMCHEGSITALHFPTPSHLISGSEDGSIALFRARDWSILRTLKGHKSRVNSVAVHPSGKVALSVGKDRTLRMWDLMRGKAAGSTKLGKEGEVVRWSTDGRMFAVQAGKDVDLYATNMTLLHTLTHPSRIHDVKFVKPDAASDSELLLVAAEDKKLSIYSLPHDLDAAKGIEPRLVAEAVGHENRVKAVDVLRISLPKGSPTTTTVVAATTSSDGRIHVL